MTDPAAAVVPPDELRTHVERALAASYELDREMGRGGMGIVYRARDRRLKRIVAVKILPPELAYRSEIRSRFLREAETAAQLSHPNIVPIYSVDESDGIVYFVMACVDGENLGKRIHDRGPLPIPAARLILAEVADALAYAHVRGVVHRDIKPDNILLDASNDRAMVTDFGIARAVIEGSDSRLTATGMAIGTPAYMSPEQASGDREIDGRSDLYALGVVGYQMLAGELPFKASSTPAMLVKHLSERPVPIDQRRPDVPRDLADAVMRLLEKDPDHRFATAGELEAALRGRGPVAAASFATTQPPMVAPPMPSALPSMRGPAPSGMAPAETAASPGMPAAGSYRMDPALAPASLLAPHDTGELDPSTASPAERAKWEARPVIEFRRKLGWYAIIGSVLLIISIFGNSDFFGVLGLWTVFIAFKYAKLWSDGYSWHDVLQQPRDRLFADVASEWGDDVQALFDPKKRDRVRERARRRALRAGYDASAAPPNATYAGFERATRDNATRTYGTYGDAALTALAPQSARDGGPRGGIPRASGDDVDAQVRQAAADHQEVLRLLEAMPKSERARVSEAGPAAEQLAAKVRGLAVRIAEIDHDSAPGAVAVLEAEISRLEAEANPLDRAASDERVRRLAYLKRQRRSLTDLARRRDQAAGAMESCRLALQNLRLDLVRLRTGGGGTPAAVTTLAERAMVLAREVDGIVGAASEVARIGAPGAAAPGGALPGGPLGATGSRPARA